MSTGPSPEPLPLAISTGDPGGVGPTVAAEAVARLPSSDSAVVFGDAGDLAGRLSDLGLAGRLRRLTTGTVGPGEIGLVHAADWNTDALRHQASPAGGLAQLAALQGATDWALTGRARAVVTAPISKAAVNLSGQAFTGHTEYLAERAGLSPDAVTMMFLGPQLRVGLATTHISIASAPTEVTRLRVERAIVHLGEALVRLSRDAAPPPKLWVCGLNPHAGEGGLFGSEEARSIDPGVVAAAQRPPFADGRVELRGPLGAETAFRLAAGTERDGVVAMLHDQATIASKLLDWGQAVNVTWGLPFVRTSVDHGVAYDAAASGQIDAAGMLAAVAMARRLTGTSD